MFLVLGSSIGYCRSQFCGGVDSRAHIWGGEMWVGKNPRPMYWGIVGKRDSKAHFRGVGGKLQGPCEGWGRGWVV